MDRIEGERIEGERIVVLTGAGISTDSGIPDFRGPQGVWTKDPSAMRSSNIADYVADPEVRRRVWRMRLASPAWTAKPNPGHLALVELERQGRLLALVTQNIDGLHQRAGSAPERILELHGTLFDVECLTCDARSTMEAALERVAAGEPDPPCLICGGVQKAATISFGQALRADVLDAAVPRRLFIPPNVATGLHNIGDEEAWLVNYPDPPYDPGLKDEQVEYTEKELEDGVVK